MADDIQEVAEEAIEYVTVSPEDVAEFARRLARAKTQFGFLGSAIGAIVGSAAAYFITKRLAERKYSQISDAEIEEMREHYHAKGKALEAQAGKGDLEKLVQERGYSSPKPEKTEAPPMAVQPPASVIEADESPPDDSAMAENSVEGPNGVKDKGETAVRNIFREREQVDIPAWDPHAERRRRSPDRPYVIHYDERHEMEGYSEVSYTYYAADDVLCNERDEVIDPAMRDDLIGEANLERFGHGNPDPSIVFVRNDNLEILYEIIKSPNSFAEEVHGFTHESMDRGNLERMRRRERDEES